MMRDAAEIAQACADALWALDKASRAMGMKIEKVGPGFAVLSMSVRVRASRDAARADQGPRRLWAWWWPPWT
jgi:hypothetical protein